METLSTLRELLAVKYVLDSFGKDLVGQNILWYTDNQNVPIIIQKVSTKIHLNQIALENFAFSMKCSIEILPVWIPRDKRVGERCIKEIGVGFLRNRY